MTRNDKIKVALNPNTPVDILLKLTKDKNEWVRATVAQNPNIPVEGLRKLITDDKYTVRRQIALNPKVPRTLLVMLFEYEKSLALPVMYVLKNLYRHANFPEFAKRVMTTLYGDIPEWL